MVPVSTDTGQVPGKQERAYRVHLEVPLYYRVLGSKQWVSARLVNISGTGILFHTFDELANGTRIEVNFHLPAVGKESAGGEVAGKAVIIRSVAAAVSAAEVAVKLIGPRLRPSAARRTLS